MTPTTAGLPRLGRYAIVREIARSNDIVWEGVDTELNRRVAVKELVLDPSLTGAAKRQRVERFRREARAAGNLNHPNIVTIHAVGEEAGRYFIAMEYLEGQTLRSRLDVAGALPVTEAIGIAGDLCEALDYAHGHGVIHRDIKPDNIHLVPVNRVKLTDFGIARITSESQITVAGQVFGTPSYMSPEQVVGRDIDHRSDLFSLGIVLYEMITGRKPFTGDSVVTITYRILNDPTPPLLGASPALDNVIRRATAKDPAQRYASAAEFRAALHLAREQRTRQTFLPGSLPPPHAAPAPPEPTSAYGARTQYEVQPAPVAPVAPPPPSAPPAFAAPAAYEPPAAAPGGGRRAAVGVAVLVVGVVAVGGGWALATAFKNYSNRSGAPPAALPGKDYQAATDFNGAAALYQAKKYHEAARAFHALRYQPGTGSELRDKAARSEAYCYLALGEASRKGGDLDQTKWWFYKARELAPDDETVKKALASLPTMTAANGAGSGSPAPQATPPPLPEVQRLLPDPNIRQADWRRENQIAEQKAAAFLQDALLARQRGNQGMYLDYLQKAVSEGRGGPSAQQAMRMLNEATAQGAGFGG